MLTCHARYIFLMFIDGKALQPCASTRGAWGCSALEYMICVKAVYGLRKEQQRLKDTYTISAQWAEAERVKSLVQVFPFKQIHFGNT